MIEAAPCPKCAVPIPGVVVNAPFCPFCGVEKGRLRADAPGAAAAAAPIPVAVAPQAARGDVAQFFRELGQAEGGQRPDMGKLQAMIAHAKEKQEQQVRDGTAKPPQPFSAWAGDLALSFDPRVGFVLVGASAANGNPTLRAYSLHDKRVLWDALSNEPAVGGVEAEHLSIHKGNVYVALDRKVRALDLVSGAPKWGCEISDAVKHEYGVGPDSGAMVLDPAPPGARGPVWIITVDDVITALDRDTGQPLFREQRENLPRKIRVVDPGLLMLETGSSIQLVDPVTKNVLDKIEGSIERFDRFGQYGVVQVRRFGWRERDGVLLHDFFAKKEVLFEAIENLEDDVPSAIGHGRVFCAMDSGAKLVGAPNPMPRELMPGFHIRAMTMCGPTLMVMLSKHHGTSIRRVLGVDPMTLAVRFDLGELKTEPDDDWDRQMISNGYVTVVVTSPTGDDDKCELFAVDPSGRIVWRTPVESWRGHQFIGNHIVAYSASGFRVLRPDNGQPVAQYLESDFA